jgi:hypothetical protein
MKKEKAAPSYFPSRTTLALAWIVLIGLTIGTMFTGRVTLQATLGVPLFAALLFVTWLKTAIILRTYLNLRTVPAAADALTILVGLVLAVIATLYVLAH